MAASLHPLTESGAVGDYLLQSPIALKATCIQKLQGGMINFVYRIHLHPDNALGNPRQKTAIMKHATSYIASNPTISFSSDRQTFEARALRNIPWKKFRYQDTNSESHTKICRAVNLPELYFEDPQNRALIMQDCRMETEKAWNPELSSDGFQVFCEKPTASKWKHETARTIGFMIGEFLAQLHNWGANEPDHAKVIELFGANIEAVELVVQFKLNNLNKHLIELGYQTSEKQKCMLEKRMLSLKHFIYAHKETVVLPDLRYVV